MYSHLKQDLFILVIAVMGVLAAVPILTYLYFARDLISKETIMNRNDTGLILLDRQKRPFFTFYQPKYKIVVPLFAIPKQTQQAVIAAEDKDFYKHSGFSIKAMVRSLFLDIKKRESAYGGSTLTQQLVKNALLTNSKNFLRKYQEVVLAQEIERRYKKQEILEMYLNSVYFGEGAFGIEEAARTYFGKTAKDLSLAESSILVAVLTAPSKYSPISGSIKNAKERQWYVLSNMVEQGYITQKQAEEARSAPLSFNLTSDTLNSTAPHFAIMVRDELIKKYGEEAVSRSGFKVQTSIDLDLQKYAEEAVRKQVAHLAPNRVSNAAAVVIDPKTGELKALVGSTDWYNDKFGKVNMVTALRQPGSSFKPIIYAGALEKHAITLGTQLHDQPTTFQRNYRPQNYDSKFRGIVSPRRALANSLNVPSVEVLSKIGVEEGLEEAKKFGITTLKDPSNYGLSLVLGSAEVKLLELTNAYAVFANQGVQNNIVSILKIEDKHNHTIYVAENTKKQVIDTETAFLISSILSDNRARQEVFGNTLTLSRPAAVKTGTTENYKDALTVGYTPSLVVGVWVGNNDGTTMDSVAGSLGAAPIWRSIMEYSLKGTPIEKFEMPNGIVATSVCYMFGNSQNTASASAGTEYFIAGTQPRNACVINDISISPTQPVVQASSSQPTPTSIITPTVSSSPTSEQSPAPSIFIQLKIKKNEGNHEN